MHTLLDTGNGWEVYSGDHWLCTVNDMLLAMRLVAWLNGGEPIGKLKPSQLGQIIERQ